MGKVMIIIGYTLATLSFFRLSRLPLIKNISLIENAPVFNGALNIYRDHFFLNICFLDWKYSLIRHVKCYNVVIIHKQGIGSFEILAITSYHNYLYESLFLDLCLVEVEIIKIVEFKFGSRSYKWAWPTFFS